MGGGSSTRRVTQTRVAEAITEVLVEQTQNCLNTLNSTNDLNIECTAAEDVRRDPDTGTITFYEANRACVECYDQIRRLEIGVDSTESAPPFGEETGLVGLNRRQWSSGASFFRTPPTKAALYSQLLSRFLACKGVCKACVVSDVNQSAVYLANVSCELDATSQTELNTALKNRLNQLATEERDIFAAVVGVAESALGAITDASTDTKIEQLIETRILNQVTLDQLQSIVNEAIAENRTTFRGNNITAGSISQQSVQTAIFSQVLSLDAVQNIVSVAEAQAAQTSFDRSNITQDVALAVGNVVKGAFDLYSDTVAFVFIAGGVALVIIGITLIVLFARKKSELDRRKAAQKSSSKTAATPPAPAPVQPIQSTLVTVPNNYVPTYTPAVAAPAVVSPTPVVRG